MHIAIALLLRAPIFSLAFLLPIKQDALFVSQLGSLTASRLYLPSVYQLVLVSLCSLLLSFPGAVQSGLPCGPLLVLGAVPSILRFPALPVLLVMLLLSCWLFWGGRLLVCSTALLLSCWLCYAPAVLLIILGWAVACLLHGTPAVRYGMVCC